MVKKKNEGKQFDLKIKPFLIYEYLKQATDENNFVSAENIKAHIEEFGISTSIPSVYRDIEEINKAILLVRGEADTIEDAEEKIFEHGDEYKTIICVRKNPKWSQDHFRLTLLQIFINIFIF